MKNINSFSFVKKSIEYEIKRQIEILEKGETPKQETRGFNEAKGKTFSQRSKEEAQDYRYFPEPDIPPMKFSDEFIENIKKDMPELPQQKLERFMKVLTIRYQEAFILTRDIVLANFFEKVISNSKQIPNFKQSIANLIINKKLSVNNISVEEFVKKAMKELKPKETDLVKLDVAIKRSIEENQKVVEDFKNGKKNALMFLVGQVMKEMRGQADAKIVIKKLEERLI